MRDGLPFKSMNDAAKDAYLEGLKLYGEGKFEEAVQAFDRGLAERPDWTDLLQAKGMAQMNGGHHAQALETLLRVTEMAPEDPSAFTSLSMCYQRLDKIEEAEQAQARARMLSWKQELKTNPNAPPPDPGPMSVQQ